MRVDISFAYFTSATDHAAFLFAHTDRPLTRGEPTSDHLAFYGFGTGLFSQDAYKNHPKWLAGQNFFSLPAPMDWMDKGETDDESWLKILPAYARFIAELSFVCVRRTGMTLDRGVVKRLYITLASIMGYQNLTVDQLDNSIIPASVYAAQNSVATTLVAGVDRHNNWFLTLGVPAIPGELTDELLSKLTGIQGTEGQFNWAALTNVGGDYHANQVIRSLNAFQFSDDHDATKLDVLAKRMDRIYPPVGVKNG